MKSFEEFQRDCLDNEVQILNDETEIWVETSDNIQCHAKHNLKICFAVYDENGRHVFADKEDAEYEMGKSNIDGDYIWDIDITDVPESIRGQLKDEDVSAEYFLPAAIIENELDNPLWDDLYEDYQRQVEE